VAILLSHSYIYTSRIFVNHNTLTNVKWKCVNFEITVLNLKMLALFHEQNNINTIKFICTDFF